MIQRRFISILFILLFAFAQQQAMIHPYVHLANEQEKTPNNKQIPAHSDVCSKCVALAGIGSAIGAQTHALHVLPTTFELAVFVALPFFSSTTLPYSSRAPPSLV